MMAAHFYKSPKRTSCATASGSVVPGRRTAWYVNRSYAIVAKRQA